MLVGLLKLVPQARDHAAAGGRCRLSGAPGADEPRHGVTRKIWPMSISKTAIVSPGCPSGTGAQPVVVSVV